NYEKEAQKNICNFAFRDLPSGFLSSKHDSFAYRTRRYRRFCRLTRCFCYDEFMSRKKHAKTRDEDETRNIQSSNSPFPLGSVRKSTHWEQLLYTFRCGTVGSMKSKTSITLSRDLLEDLDRIFGDSNNRSRVIETAVRE